MGSLKPPEFQKILQFGLLILALFLSPPPFTVKNFIVTTMPFFLKPVFCFEAC